MRCAIYTRKSSDEGLDQDFNSLDAQYEACASYIASQRHEGWKLVRNRYDDGGISGGTLDRPALKRLLEDIEAGRIQMVVVYKIDRLTRSLADFAKLVERLEASGCSFVSVTQAFNTSSSMGRLTLNVLLSFAQFEREVTAERIRDKISASKQKGLWMGGVCPLGYDPHPDPQKRTLVVNEAEAETVKKLFRLYEEYGCLRLVEREAHKNDLRSKRHVYATGRSTGGKLFSRGQIYYVLRNPLYIGQIRHKEKTYPGQHPGIIPMDLWDQVQAKMKSAARRKRGQSEGQAAPKFLLTGKLVDETGDRLTPTSTRKGHKAHRYYVSNRLITGTKDPAAWRLSARQLEEKIALIAVEHLTSQSTLVALSNGFPAQQVTRLQSSIEDLARSMRENGRPKLSELVAQVRLAQDHVLIRFNGKGIGDLIGMDSINTEPSVCNIRAPWQIKRRGVESKIVIGEEKPRADKTLLKSLAQAHTWVSAIRNGVPLKSIADAEGVTSSYIKTRMKLAFLSPRIQSAILEGRLDPRFTTNQILRTKMPMDWRAQETLFLQA